DKTIELQVTPNDPFFNEQWDLAVTDVPDAWRFTTGSSSVLLVSLDTGLPRVPTGAGTPALPGKAAVLGDDLDPKRLNTSDPGAISTRGDDNHGHRAISIMASWSNNRYGVAGINWTSPVRVENPYGFAPYTVAGGGMPSDLVKAIQNALDAKAKDQVVVFQGGI